MRPRLTAAEAPWQVEIDRGPEVPVEYVSAKAIKLTSRQMTIVTPDGEKIVQKSKGLRKLLIMATTEEEA